ncbi:TAP42-like family-domain-containing protein, partial [Globomyces pollinis-pini]
SSESLLQQTESLETHSLAESFSLALDLYNKLLDTTSDQKDYKNLLDNTIRTLNHCYQLSLALHLYSDNETQSDLNNNQLNYLLIQPYLALSILHLNNRPFALSKARILLNSFLDTIQQYNLLSAIDKDINNVIIENQAKDPDNDDYEINRDLILTTIELLVQQSIQALKDIKEEQQMLDYAATLPKTPESANDDRLDMTRLTLNDRTGPLLDSSGKPLRPFVITSDHDKRAQFQKGVFQYGHNLPTMSIEEYLDREYERGNMLSGGGPQPEKENDDEDDERVYDAATYKARQFDDFKDFNPRGWGNRANKG